MRRRTLIVGIAAVASRAAAQQRQRLVIGWLSAAPHPMLGPFEDQLSQLGYRRGANLEIRERYAEGDPERLPDLARALAAGGVDVIIASGAAAAQAVRRATPDQRALFVSANPVQAGLVASHARPGGKLSGISLQMEDIASKWPEILREALPQARRVGIVADRQNPGTNQQDVATAAAKTLGLAVIVFDVGGAADIEPKLEAARAADVDGVIVCSSPLFSAYAAAVVGAAARLRLPAIYEHRQFTEAGGLLSYGPDLAAVFRRLAVLAERVARGADPGEIPVEQPTRFELVVNVRAAREIGLALPPALLARADEVIE